MGSNILYPKRREWQDKYDILEQHYHHNLLLLKHKSSQKELIAKMLTVNSQKYQKDLDNILLRKRKKMSKFVSQLVDFVKIDGDNCCGGSRYLIVVQKGTGSLREQSYNRKFKFQHFLPQELLIVLQSTVKGLIYLQEMGQHHGRVCSENILSRDDRTVFLVEPLLFGNEETSIYKMNETGFNYPSPEKILFQNDMIDKYDKTLSDYYSLGVVLLELAFLQPMDYIYEKGYRKVNSKRLAVEIAKIQNCQLREKIMKLTNHYPEARREIERFYRKGKENQQILQNMITQDPKIQQKLQTQNTQKINTVINHHFDEKVMKQREFILHQSDKNTNIDRRPVIRFINGSTPMQVHKFSPNIISKPNIANQINETLMKNMPKSIITHKQSINEPEKLKESCEVNNSLDQIREKLQSYQEKQKLAQFQVLKEAQSINVSLEDRSDIVSEVIGHGFSAKNSLSIGLNANNDALDQVRKSMPQNIQKQSSQSIQKRQSLPLVTTSGQKPPKPRKSRQVDVTPQKQHVKKRNHSTIKEVSEESPSMDSHSFDVEQIGQKSEFGAQYIGQLKNGKRNGTGIFYFKDNSFYEGQWKDNRMHGKGCLYYSNGQLAYEGGWYMDAFHGKGKMYNDSPVQMKVNFNHKNINVANQCWEVYDGQFFNGKKNGRGKFKIANGEVFVGDFIEDKANGQGKFYKNDGGIVHGKWIQGILVKQFS